MEATSNSMTYLECSKPGYHYGEALNVVCLETSCLDKALCCSACVEEEHKKHTYLFGQSQHKTPEASDQRSSGAQFEDYADQYQHRHSRGTHF